MIRVAISFYSKGKEQNRWTEMPQVPAVNSSLWFDLGPRGPGTTVWQVKHVSWVYDEGMLAWHAEIGVA